MPRSAQRLEDGRGDDARLLATFLDGAPDAILGVDGGGRILFANRQTERLLGYDRDELTGEHVEMLVPERLRPRYASFRQRYARKPVRRPIGEGPDLVARRRDGTELPVEVGLEPSRTASGLVVTVAIRDASVRRDAERRLREGERELRQAQRVARLGSWEFDVERRQVRWSDELYRIYGLAPGDPRGGRLDSVDLIHPDDRERVRDGVRRALDRHESLGFEYRILRPDGVERVLQSFVEPIEDPDTGAVRIFGTAQDITDRRLAQRYLAEQNAFFEAVLRHAADAILACDARGRLVFVNAAARRLAGIPPDQGDLELGSAQWGEAYDSSGRLLAVGEWPVFRALRGETTIGCELRVVRPDGGFSDVLLSAIPVRDPQGAVIGAIVTAPDITARKAAEARLREGERRLSTLLANLPGVAYRCRYDEDLTIEFVSEGCIALSGYSPGDLLGNRRLSWADLTHPDDRARVWEEVQVALRDDRPFQLLYRMIHASGEEKWVWEQGSGVRSADGELVALEGFITDITDRQRALEELAGARDEALAASRLKSAFLSTISHEIRTPLNVILGYNSLIAEHLDEIGDRSQRGMLQGIERAGRRLISTVHQILDYSRMETGDFEVQPSNLVLDAVLEPVIHEYEAIASEKGLVFSWRNAVPGAEARFDPHCLSGAVRNLLDNAVKFTPRGEIAVRLDRDASGALVLVVHDTGVGIAEHFLPHLFEPFNQEEIGYTRPFEGSGIGLALTRRYLELNGARVSVRSRKGVGSDFTIHFSRVHEPEPPPRHRPESLRKPPHQAPSPGRRPAVLVVDDDADTQGYVKELLKPRFEVLVASSARKARRLLQVRPGGIGVIIMDLSLREGEDGLSLTRWIREQPEWRDVPVIAVTAHASIEDERAALEAGCSDYVAKPVSAQELLARIDRLL